MDFFKTNTLSCSHFLLPLKQWISTKRTLRGLVGGVETVSLEGKPAKEQLQKRMLDPGAGEGNLQKLLAQRAAPPTFDIVVEHRHGAHHEWSIALDTASAVGCVLEGKKIRSQRRIRDPQTGRIQMKMEEA